MNFHHYVYLFSYLDDVSWGTKGLTANSKGAFLIGKLEFVSLWAALNVLLSYLLIALNTIYKNKVILLIGWYGAITLGLKFIFALLHHFYYYSRKFIKYLSNKCRKDLEKERYE